MLVILWVARLLLLGVRISWLVRVSLHVLAVEVAHVRRELVGQGFLGDCSLAINLEQMLKTIHLLVSHLKYGGHQPRYSPALLGTSWLRSQSLLSLLRTC